MNSVVLIRPYVKRRDRGITRQTNSDYLRCLLPYRMRKSILFFLNSRKNKFRLTLMIRRVGITLQQRLSNSRPVTAYRCRNANAVTGRRTNTTIIPISRTNKFLYYRRRSVNNTTYLRRYLNGIGNVSRAQTNHVRISTETQYTGLTFCSTHCEQYSVFRCWVEASSVICVYHFRTHVVRYFLDDLNDRVLGVLIDSSLPYTSAYTLASPLVANIRCLQRIIVYRNILKIYAADSGCSRAGCVGGINTGMHGAPRPLGWGDLRITKRGTCESWAHRVENGKTGSM